MSLSKIPHDQKQREKIKNPSQAVNRSYSELMELADDLEEYQSERRTV